MFVRWPDAEVLAKLDAWRGDTVMTRPEAIRYLVEWALLQPDIQGETTIE